MHVAFTFGGIFAHCTSFCSSEAIILGFQHFIIMLGTTVIIPSALVPQIGGGNEEKARVVQTILFVAGIKHHVPDILWDSAAGCNGWVIYLCRTDHLYHLGRQFSTEADPHEGALIITSTIQIILGFSGLWRNVLKLLSPLSAVPMVSLVGFGLYDLASPGMMILCLAVTTGFWDM